MLTTISLWILGSFLLSALLGWRRICIQAPSRSFAGSNYSWHIQPAAKPRARRLVPTPMVPADDRVRRRVAALTRLVKRR